MQLDLRIDGAHVHTMDVARPEATTIGVVHGRIVALDEDCDGLRARRVVDLAGATVLPGFVDAHNHLVWAGQAAAALDLSRATTVDEVLALVADATRAVGPGGWVDAIGYDQRPLGRHLTRDDLDAVTAGRRFHAIHASGHAHLVNSLALADLPADFDPYGDPGVVLDVHGRPTGLFLEEATRVVNALRTPYPLAELVDAIEAAGRACAAQGITFVAEAGVGGGLASRSPVEVLAYQVAAEAGRFSLRAQLMVSLDVLAPVGAHPDDGISHAFGLGLRTGFGSDRLAIGATKAWLDGGMMARTAALTAPYLTDGEPGSGAISGDLATLRSRAVAAHAAGWQLALHAIGDRAVDVAIEVVEAAQAARPRPDARHRIEHCGLVRPDQLARLAAAGIVAVTQPTFLHEFGDDYAQIMGPERAGWLYRGRGYLEAGVAVAGSSDRPVADGAPLRAIQFLVERRSRSGMEIGPEEAMEVSEAVKAYTMGAAYACRMDDQLGSVSVGKHADLVVLGADPWVVAPSELAGIPVLATVVGGELVHGSWA